MNKFSSEAEVHYQDKEELVFQPPNVAVTNFINKGGGVERHKTGVFLVILI